MLAGFKFAWHIEESAKLGMMVTTLKEDLVNEVALPGVNKLVWLMGSKFRLHKVIIPNSQYMECSEVHIHLAIVRRGEGTRGRM